MVCWFHKTSLPAADSALDCHDGSHSEPKSFSSEHASRVRLNSGCCCILHVAIILIIIIIVVVGGVGGSGGGSGGGVLRM
eukprot:COSAG06_NODE_8100_length_2273_cov_3.034039_3_plen_80_part_00